MSEEILKWFIENIHSEEPIIIFWSSAMYLHHLDNNFNDVDLALSKDWMQKLYRKLKLKKYIEINGKKEKIDWVKMKNINVNNFWESIKLGFKISWLEFEWFVEKNERKSLFWKYFKDLNKYSKPVWKTNIHVLKRKYLSEAYVKIVSNELEEFNDTLKTVKTDFKLDSWTNLNELNGFIEKNWEVFDKKILKIFKRKDNIEKLNNLKLK